MDGSFQLVDAFGRKCFYSWNEGSKRKRIWIHASEEEGWLHVLLGNNGKQMEETQLRALRIRMRGNTSHGMSMVYQKLQNCYGDQFVMDIRSSEKGTEVITMFPSVKNWHKEDL